MAGELQVSTPAIRNFDRRRSPWRLSSILSRQRRLDSYYGLPDEVLVADPGKRGCGIDWK